MAEDQDSKTEEPTDKRLSKAREEGDVPLSQEINNLVMLTAILAGVAVIAPWTVGRMGGLLAGELANLDTIPMDPEGLRLHLVSMIGHVALYLAPVIGLLALAGLVANLGQVGFMFTPKKLEMKPSRLNPIKGFNRVLSKQKLVDLLKAVFKMGVVGAALAFIAVPSFRHPDVLMQQDFRVTLDNLHDLIMLILLAVIITYVVLAVADMVWTRYSHTKKLRMTKQEVKDEHKQSEGDPQVKGRIRSLRMKRHRDRMLANIEKASVVITNPTHYAVALEYEMDAMAAPRLTAKGVDFLAAKIRELAEEHEVPIVENPPLARALYASVEVNREIPAHLYKAVAEVIGYVMRLKNSVGGRRPPPPRWSPLDGDGDVGVTGAGVTGAGVTGSGVTGSGGPGAGREPPADA